MAIDRAVLAEHASVNRAQTLLLVGALFAIGGLAGYVLFGARGLWLALAATLLTLVLEPLAAAPLTLALYRARPIRPDEAPQLWRTLKALAARAGLPAVPQPYYVPSPVVNAFAVGNLRQSAIALTDGLLARLNPRELAAVLAHETAHIANGDLRVMNLADYVSRLTGLFALVGQVGLILTLPAWLLGESELPWLGLLLLFFSPQLALLVQLGLSRVREFDADLTAARLTGDPQALASALAKIERVTRNWRAWVLPGWGNPEPSWLRTHPHTEERIRRLLALDLSHRPTLLHAADVWPGPRLMQTSPRWYPGGFWR
ncbi:zinc metalloprotease HtpX [Allochromatium tepidum]|uniref:Zn-dependent protease n=1 Tax=Allochromatium tepidum TaxID=553982 RepID=A0ABM7QKT4_9GAMM|nr:Zn-dependent protease [Allochromatium tepidum]